MSFYFGPMVVPPTLIPISTTSLTQPLSQSHPLEVLAPISQICSPKSLLKNVFILISFLSYRNISIPPIFAIDSTESFSYLEASEDYWSK